MDEEDEESAALRRYIAANWSAWNVLRAAMERPTPDDWQTCSIDLLADALDELLEMIDRPAQVWVAVRAAAMLANQIRQTAGLPHSMTLPMLSIMIALSRIPHTDPERLTDLWSTEAADWRPSQSRFTRAQLGDVYVTVIGCVTPEQRAVVVRYMATVMQGLMGQALQE